MIICEIGLNHFGNEVYAHEYIDAVLKSEADGITFQVLKESFYRDKRFTKYKLKEEFFIEASHKIKKGGKKFGVAIDDESAIDFLESINVSFYKVLSKDITNTRLIETLINNSKKNYLYPPE